MVPSSELDPSHQSWQWAIELATAHLADMGDRWTHTQAVGRRAKAASTVVDPHEKQVLISAAWLHDIGYAPEISVSGFHPLDGARFLERQRVPKRIVDLVANHSCARFEAGERDLLPELARYEVEVSLVADALVYADMTTGPTGAPVSVDERLAEILRRYEPGSPVHRAIRDASGELEAAVSRVERRLAKLLHYPM